MIKSIDIDPKLIGSNFALKQSPKLHNLVGEKQRNWKDRRHT